MKAIFPASIDGDLLKLVHLSNGFRLLHGAEPLKAGDVVKSEAPTGGTAKDEGAAKSKKKAAASSDDDSDDIIHSVYSPLKRASGSSPPNQRMPTQVDTVSEHVRHSFLSTCLSPF